MYIIIYIYIIYMSTIIVQGGSEIRDSVIGRQEGDCGEGEVQN